MKTPGPTRARPEAKRKVALLLLAGLLCAVTIRPAAASLHAQQGSPAAAQDEPSVAFGTHHGGLWTLAPATEGRVAFDWAWDSKGIAADLRSTAILPHPDGTHDYYAAGAGGGLLRLRAGDEAAQWVGPLLPGVTNWQGYGVGASAAGGLDLDREHGDVACAALGYTGPPELGQEGLYCSYDLTAATPPWQRLDPAGGDLIGWYGSRVVVLPRPAGLPAERTALVVGMEDEVWTYIWSDAEGRMTWQGPITLTLPTAGHVVISAQAYPRPDDADRFTVFLATGDAGCLASGAGADDCSNGVILYQDFDRAGQPLGQPWRELSRHDIAQGCSIEHNLIWESHPASTARWQPGWPSPTQEAIFFSGGAWSAAALGLFSQTCLLRVQPGETPDAPYQIAGFFPSATLGYQVRGAALVPSAEAAGGWRLYILAMTPPADPAYQRILVDFEIRHSDDLGQTFALTARFANKGQYAFGPLAVAPWWRADGSSAYGLYLGSSAVLSTPQGIQRELLPGAWGGNSTMFGGGVTASGFQVASLHVREGYAGEWQSSLPLAPHTVAVGQEHIYFSSWPFSRAPGMMTDGGGLYQVDPADIVAHATLGDGSLPPFDKVWDPVSHQCQLQVPTDPALNPPPVAHYIAVDPREELVFAVMRTAGAGYDFWPHLEGCGNGLWVAHRPATASQPWTWELLLEEHAGPVFRHLWVVADAAGNFRELIVGLAEVTEDDPHLRDGFQQPFLRLFHDGADWTYEEIAVGLPLGVEPTTCRGAGFAYDPVETGYWIATAACGDQVDFPEGIHSYIRQSDDGGVTFSHWGEGNYPDRSLGATVLYRYPNGEQRLFVHARQQGVMVQADSQDPFSLSLVWEGLGRFGVTTGASALNRLWPPPSPLATRIFLPLVLSAAEGLDVRQE